MGELSSMSAAVEQLSRSPLFAGVSEAELSRLQPAPQLIHLPAGETLIRQGDTDTDYYVLVKGRLSIFVRDENGAIIAKGQVHPGEGVGEMALLMNEPRSATVVARLDSDLVRFSQESYLNLIETHPRVTMAIARLTMRRLKEQYAVRQQKECYSTIAVVPLTEKIDANALASQLALQLRAFGKSASVQRGFAGLDFSSAPNCDQAEELAALERENRYTVYSCSGGTNAWSRHCIQQADVVLLCVAAEAEPEPGLQSLVPLHGIRTDVLGRFDLVLVHGSDWTRSVKARDWIVRASFTEHHHIRAGNQKDISRLARIITGKANNLVLSGGGAKSFAQFGSLRALVEAGVPIDRAAGSSMGAYICALYCFGGDLENLVALTRKEILERRPARDHTLPVISLLTGRKLTAVATTVCGAWRIEDLPLRYFCLSADLGEAEPVEHFEGPVWEALRASCAFPGFAPPLLARGRLLADGGILNNLPIDVMHRHFSGSLIAVDVASYGNIQLGSKYEMRCPTGFELLWDKLKPFGKKEPIPSILDVIFRAATLGSQHHGTHWRKLADFLITPPVQDFKVNDFDSFDKLVEIGYRHTIEALEAAEKDAVLKSKLWPG